MRSSAVIQNETNETRGRMSALEVELKAAQLAEFALDFKAGDVVKRVNRGKPELFTIARVEPLRSDFGLLYGQKHKKDGTPGKAVTFIGGTNQVESVRP